MSGRIRQQQGGLLVLTLVVGAGFGLGLAALATFSTGQGEEAKRRITELNQTASIQYATDYQIQQLANTGDDGHSPEFLTHNSSGTDIAGTCLEDMPRGPLNIHDPESDTIATLGDGTLLIDAGTTDIPGTDNAASYAFEHYGRRLTSLVLDDESWLDFRQSNDVAYDKVFFDIWYRVDYESFFDDASTNEADQLIPLLSYFDADDKQHLRIFARLKDCKPSQSGCSGSSTKSAIEYRVQQVRNPEGDPVTWTNHLNESGANRIQSTEDGYWHYAAFYIDLSSGKAEAFYGSILHGTIGKTALSKRGDQGSYTFIDKPEPGDTNHEPLERFEQGGYWRLGDHTAVEFSDNVNYGSVRLWRQPSLSFSEASALALALFRNDRDKPGAFNGETLGAPDAVMLANGEWDQLRSLPDEDGNLVRQLGGSFWGPSLGAPTLITSKTADDAASIIFQEDQLFKHNRSSDGRGGPPAPAQLYRLYTCDENGGASRVELVRNLRRNGSEYGVSWELQL